MKLTGVYQGTARVIETIPGNPALNKDTLYTAVLFTVDRGSESTRQKMTLTLSAAPEVGGLFPAENLAIENGIVTSYESDVFAVLKWAGSISSDSMILTSSYIWVSGGNSREIFIRARRE